MNLNKLTLVIDGNWLLMSRFFMKRDSFKMDLDDSIKENSSEQLADLMSQSISVLLRQFQDNITNIIFVSDNRSWRKEYPIPECLKSDEKEDTYKGTRAQAEEYDWNYVFKSISILSKRFKDLGITTSNAYGVEGDDWCWWWSRKLNAEGINVLLWTSDEDIKQLIQEDPETGAFTAWYEKSKGLILNSSMEEGTGEIEDDLSFFMEPIRKKNKLVDSLKKVTKISYVNPITIINKKIYIGDSGDNILPTFTYTKNSKLYKATQNDWKKVIDFDINNYAKKEWDGTLENLYKDIYNIKKKSIGNNITTINEFKEHVKYNKKMVWLDESQIPENIQSQMSTIEYTEISPDLMHDIKYNWKTISNVDREEIHGIFDMPDF